VYPYPPGLHLEGEPDPLPSPGRGVRGDRFHAAGLVPRPRSGRDWEVRITDDKVTVLPVAPPAD